MAPLEALLPYTCQGLLVVWHTGSCGAKKEEGGGFFRSGMVETPEGTQARHVGSEPGPQHEESKKN
jgi:hypothetical protein